MCAETQYRLVGGGALMVIYCVFALGLVSAQSFAGQEPNVGDKIESTRASISEAERKQRENLSTLFVINSKIKQIAKKRSQLNQKLFERESEVRLVAQELHQLEVRTERQKAMLNKRLRQLYQDRNRDSFKWLFSARSPVELERNHRFLKRMIDSDHRHLKTYLTQVHELSLKRDQLRNLVAGLSRLQKDIQGKETQLADQMRERARHVAELNNVKARKLSELKGLRASGPTNDEEKLSFAFFERRGSLRPPVEAPLVREYGTYVDSQFKFRLMHKGLFYAAKKGAAVMSVFDGKVALAGVLPGYGKTVIIDHGDNYYSVYGFASQLKVKEGGHVREGDVVALSGGSSPLFGPGLYFEIRHFTDAIDPRNWIKDSVLKTVQNHTNLRSYLWENDSGH